MKKTRKTIVTIWINPEILDKLDKFAKRADISRSQLIHNLLSIGYDEIKLQKNLGIIKLTLSLERLQAKIAKLLSGAKKKIVIVDPDKKGTNLSIRIDPELMKKIDALANKLSMSRSIFIEYLLEISIKELKYINFPGIIDSALLIRDLDDKIRETWKKLFKKSKKALKEKEVVTKIDENLEENNN
ncbi:ribbon-helix-helix protein, CopG family [Desulfobacula phenolica]|uniref:Ribbon-helix-helix protein, copG family n=1 Tax=Desulfobacula phenolica TaxID=90732 RepID=A0A1H2HJ04_9BACT|nr:ribbon-helix-helix protein, CopG family [Desulfobacula phenolica]SDU31804.1 Ribbon-helix-helix protein, copG family [Desulfobacula phenolica]